MDMDDFADRLVKENKDEFNVFLDTLKDIFEHQQKEKGKKHHE